jgi:hypothetical protein
MYISLRRSALDEECVLFSKRLAMSNYYHPFLALPGGT